MCLCTSALPSGSPQTLRSYACRSDTLLSSDSYALPVRLAVSAVVGSGVLAAISIVSKETRRDAKTGALPLLALAPPGPPHSGPMPLPRPPRPAPLRRNPRPLPGRTPGTRRPDPARPARFPDSPAPLPARVPIGPVSDSPRVHHRCSRMVRGRCQKDVAIKYFGMVARDGIEPSTRGFSVQRRARFGATKPKKRKGVPEPRPNRPRRPSPCRTPRRRPTEPGRGGHAGQRVVSIVTERGPNLVAPSVRRRGDLRNLEFWVAETRAARCALAAEAFTQSAPDRLSGMAFGT
jgi:hypothetical protein